MERHFLVKILSIAKNLTILVSIDPRVKQVLKFICTFIYLYGVGFLSNFACFPDQHNLAAIYDKDEYHRRKRTNDIYTREIVKIAKMENFSLHFPSLNPLSNLI